MNSIPESIIRLEERLFDIYYRHEPPDPEDFFSVIEKTNSVLLNEDSHIRPYDINGLPGGLVMLKQDIETVIVPDIHGRLNLLMNILMTEENQGRINLHRLMNNELQIVCLGDGMHAESRAARRWDEAGREYMTEFAVHDAMDDEMRESFGIMEMVMELKCACPGNFHFLKGNHENISNESGNGNHPFMKFSYEGVMVALYVRKFYGEGFMAEYYAFEKNLPLLAAGRNFLISHAEPEEFYARDLVINYRDQPRVVEGLTWTSDGGSDEDIVVDMIREYLDPLYYDRSYYFGGHRPVKNLYNARFQGRYVQIHNPDKLIIAKINPVGDIDLDRDILELQ